LIRLPGIAAGSNAADLREVSQQQLTPAPIPTSIQYCC
jgi:hypothetical protein